MDEMKWTTIWEDSHSGTYRMKVFGGWLVRDEFWSCEDTKVNLCFVPDQYHAWECEEY